MLFTSHVPYVPNNCQTAWFTVHFAKFVSFIASSLRTIYLHELKSLDRINNISKTNDSRVYIVS